MGIEDEETGEQRREALKHHKETYYFTLTEMKAMGGLEGWRACKQRISFRVWGGDGGQSPRKRSI